MSKGLYDWLSELDSLSFDSFINEKQECGNIVSKIANIIKGCYGASSRKIIFYSGRIVGENDVPVRLPVDTDCVISLDDSAVQSGNVIFHAYMLSSQYSQILKDVFNALSKCRSSTSTKTFVIDRTYQENDIVVETVVGSDISTVVPRDSSEMVVIYRTASEMHLKCTFLEECNTIVKDLDFDEVDRVNRTEIVVSDSNIRYMMVLDSNGGSEMPELSIRIQVELPKLKNVNDKGNEFWISLAELVWGNVRVFTDSFNGVFCTIHRDFYYPNIFGDRVSDVKKHYDWKKIGRANVSRIPIVRTVNNQVKRHLIGDFVEQNVSVLDLACGHGQDILKYVEKNVSLYVGIDISTQEICEARRRLRERQGQMSGTFDTFRFHVGNMLQPNTYEKFIVVPTKDDIDELNHRGKRHYPDKIPMFIQFDVVSVQLAIHYCLSSIEDAEIIIRNISSYLRSHGRFVGSCPCSLGISHNVKTNLRRHLGSNLEDVSVSKYYYEYGNDIYHVRFDGLELQKLLSIDYDSDGNFKINDNDNNWVSDDKSNNNDNDLECQLQPYEKKLMDSSDIYYLFNHMWGVRYHFWLTGHINVEEYTVPWVAFCRLCKRYGLICKLRENFVSYYNRTTGDSKLTNSRNDRDQVECIGFYKIFVFEKL